jgi:hypothetical protein
MACPVIFFMASFSKFMIFDVIRPPVIAIVILLVWMVIYLFKKDPGNSLKLIDPL